MNFSGSGTSATIYDVIPEFWFYRTKSEQALRRKIGVYLFTAGRSPTARVFHVLRGPNNVIV